MADSTGFNLHGESYMETYFDSNNTSRGMTNPAGRYEGALGDGPGTKWLEKEHGAAGSADGTPLVIMDHRLSCKRPAKTTDKQFAIGSPHVLHLNQL